MGAPFLTTDGRPRWSLGKTLLFPDRAMVARQWLDHRLLTGVAFFFLALGGPLLWFWDWTIDPAGAGQTLGLRLLFLLNIGAGFWQLRQPYRPWAPWILVSWILTTLVVYLEILAKLKGGLGPGTSGLLFWTMAGMVMLQGCRLWVNIIYTAAVYCLPLVYAKWDRLPGFSPDLYGLVVFPASLVGLAVQTVNTWNYLRRYQAECQLDKLSKTDPLTGLLNRRAFFEAFQERTVKSGGPGNALALFYFDIDHFKAVNDTHGHAAGDAVIVNLAQTCQAICRKNDLVARMGGEEFAMVIEGEDASQALVIAERLRQCVEAQKVPAGDLEISYTISIGVTWEGPGDRELSRLLNQADQALYQAKEGGRNRVVLKE